MLRMISLRHRIRSATGSALLLLALAPIASGVLYGQANPDSIHLRNDCRLAEQVLLHALLLLHPALDRDADGVRHRQDLVGAEPDDAVGGDAAHLAVDLLEGDARAEAEGDEAAAEEPRQTKSWVWAVAFLLTVWFFLDILSMRMS